MSLRYGLLGLLAERPASGYDITQEFKRTLHAAWPASHPQIYRELAKLADEGLIEAQEEGARGRKAYKITPEGLKAIKSWLTSGPVDHSFRSETLIRSFFFWLMSTEDIEKHLASEKAYFEAQAKAYKQYAAAKDRGDFGDSAQTESARITVEAAVRMYDAFAEWAEWASNRVASKKSSL